MIHPRSAACWLAAALLAATAAGCGGSTASTTAVETATPAVTFAPLVHLARDEPFMPTRGRWFTERSTLWWIPAAGCAPDPVAAGLEVKGAGDVEGMFTSGLGWGTAYWRRAYADSGCDRVRPGRFYTNQLNRPHDSTPGRAPGLGPSRGFYLDLMDEMRARPPPRTRDGQRVTYGDEAMFERHRATVDGEPGLRLTYWMLYGMNRPAGLDGRPLAALTHEGDWERVEVLVRAGDGANSWEPVALRMADPDGGWRRLPWDAVRRVRGPGGEATHPELFAARGSHTVYARPGRHRRAAGDGSPVAALDVTTAPCAWCTRWAMWQRPLNGQGPLNARMDSWYGFGGAWGDVGPTSPTTGPLGPHGPSWPAGNAVAQEKWRQSQPWGG